MSGSAVTAHCLTGYYGFLDYAAANWWKHARRIERNSEGAFLAALAKLAEALNSRHQMATSNTTTDRAPVWAQMHHIPDDGRDCEDAFPVEARVKMIRACLEPLLGGHANTGSPADLEEMFHLYGRVTYKCSKPWCYYFHAGFETAHARDQHVRQHERPFKCGADGCLSAQIGFAKESELARHNERVHSEAVSVHFPSGLRSSTIFKAAREGNLELVQEHVASGTSVDAWHRDGSTPLFLAAQAGHYQVCRWLLEHGATADAWCTREGITALWAAVARDDLEIASLLIVDHGASKHIRNSSGRHILDLVESPSCTRIRERFPLEFWHTAKKGPDNMMSGVPHGQPERKEQDHSKTTGTNSAIPDYQLQLLLHEQQNKKRLMMARQEQDYEMQRRLLDLQNKKRLMMKPQGQKGQDLTPTTTSNHALQDYEYQRQLIEQQAKKRLMIARQEQGPSATQSGQSFQDFQTQLMLFEQQNKERLMKESRELYLAADPSGQPLPPPDHQMERQTQEQGTPPTWSDDPVGEFRMLLQSENRLYRDRMQRVRELQEQEQEQSTTPGSYPGQDYHAQLLLAERQYRERIGRAFRKRLGKLQNERLGLASEERVLIERQQQEKEQEPRVTGSNSEHLQGYQAHLMQAHLNLKGRQNRKRKEIEGIMQEYKLQVQLLEEEKSKRPMMEPPAQERLAQDHSKPTGSNHALKDYDMQLLLLEQQNMKRLKMPPHVQDLGTLTMAAQEQDLSTADSGWRLQDP